MKAFLPLIFLLGCVKSSDWSTEQIKEKNTQSKRISHHTKNPVDGIDVEMLLTENEIITYLQIQSKLLEQETVSLALKSKDGQLTFQIPFHRGGQRIRLPAEVQEELFSLLSKGLDVTIAFSGYSETINESVIQLIESKQKRHGSSVLSKIRLY